MLPLSKNIKLAEVKILIKAFLIFTVKERCFVSFRQIFKFVIKVNWLIHGSWDRFTFLYKHLPNDYVKSMWKWKRSDVSVKNKRAQMKGFVRFWTHRIFWNKKIIKDFSVSRARYGQWVFRYSVIFLSAYIISGNGTIFFSRNETPIVEAFLSFLAAETNLNSTVFLGFLLNESG